MRKAAIYRLVDESKARPGTPARRAGAESPTSIRRASGSRSSIRVTENSAYRPFPDEQIAALIPLVSGTSRSATVSGRGKCPSAIPTSPRRRKEDPGELFPHGGALAKRPAGAAEPERVDLIDPVFWTDRRFPARFGAFSANDVTDTQKAVIAFQRRFRPDLIDGIIDGEMPGPKLLAPAVCPRAAMISNIRRSFAYIPPRQEGRAGRGRRHVLRRGKSGLHGTCGAG